MWTTKMQTDTWINLGGNGDKPDYWVRVSSVDRVHMVAGAKYAVVVLKSGEQLASSFTAKQLMDRIGGEQGGG